MRALLLALLAVSCVEQVTPAMIVVPDVQFVDLDQGPGYVRMTIPQWNELVREIDLANGAP